MRQRRRVPPPPDIPSRGEEAETAFKSAREELERTRRRTMTVKRVAMRLREIRAENDFAETLKKALGP